MSATVVKTSKTANNKTLGAVTKKKETPKKKLSYYQKKKAIDEIAHSINAGMTRRYLFDMLFRKDNLII